MKQKDLFRFLNQLPDPVILIDVNQDLLFISTELEQLLGYSQNSLIGHSLFSLTTQSNQDAQHSKMNYFAGVSFNLSLKTSSNRSILFHTKSSKSTLEGSVVEVLSLRRTELVDVKQAEIQHKAISTWEIGIYENNHVTGEVYASSRVRELYGFSSDEELSFDSFAKKFHEIESDIMLEKVRQSYDPENDGIFEMIHQIVGANGESRWLHSKSHTFFGWVDGERKATTTMGSVMEVTARQKLEDALIHSEELLTQATKVSQVGIFEHDHRSKLGEDDVDYWSPTFRKIIGYDQDKKPDSDWYFERVHPDDLTNAQKAVSDSHDPTTDGNYNTEHRWLHPDGHMHWLLLRGKTTFSEVNGERKPLLSVGGIIDVTQRHQIEEDIQRRSQILEATPDFVSITDPEGRFIYLNKAGRSLLGFSSEEDVSTKNMLSVYTEASRQLVETSAISIAITEGSWKAETEFEGAKGKIYPMSQVLLTNLDADDKVAYISIVARDLTKEKKLEEQFNQAQKMDAVGRLAGGIAHDFNNMLSIIMGFTTLASDKLDEDHDAQGELDEVLKASQRAAALTKHLLAFSRKQILKPRVINVHQLLCDMEPMVKRLMDESIHVNVKPSKVETYIKADPIQVEQIIINLVSNARDAMPNGGDLSIEAQQVNLVEEKNTKLLELASGPYVKISVSDTGHGMSEKVKEKVFEPFFTTKDLGHGTGLGLATVFGIVKQSQGGIWLDSELEKGTVVNLYFPSSFEGESKATEESVNGVTNKGNAEVILVTEDNEPLREMVTRTLKKSGYTVLSANEGGEALDILEKYPGNIDLLLTDVVMPRMSGKQLADAANLEQPGINVLYMSGYTEDSIVHQGVLDDNVNFLAKPVTPSTLLHAISVLLKNTKL